MGRKLPVSNEGLPTKIEVRIGKAGSRLFMWRGEVYSIRHVHRRWKTAGTSRETPRWHWQIYADIGTAIIAREEEVWYLERWLL